MNEDIYVDSGQAITVVHPAIFDFVYRREPGCVFVGDLSVRLKKRVENREEPPEDQMFWSDEPYRVFYRPDGLESNGYDNRYFGIRQNGDGVFIVDATSVSERLWGGVFANNGDFIFSRWVHDFRYSRDGSVAVDGGPHYTRILWYHGVPPVKGAVRIINGEFRLVERDGKLLADNPKL